MLQGWKFKVIAPDGIDEIVGPGGVDAAIEKIVARCGDNAAVKVQAIEPERGVHALQTSAKGAA